MNKTNNFFASPKSRIIIALNYLLLTLFTVSILLPIYIVFNISFKDNQEYAYKPILALPHSFLNFSNYTNVVEKGRLLLGFRNSLVVMGISILISVLFGTMVAYVLSRFDFKFKKLILGLFLGAAIIPNITTTVATFKIIKNLHLFNSLAGLILIYMGANVISIYIFMQFIAKLPKDLDESALVDGASYYRIYFSIILPLMKPAVVTVLILTGVSIYNDFFWPLFITPKSDLIMVTTAIMKFSYDQNSQWNIMAAGILIVMLPTLIVYLFLQKYIIAGVAQGAVKG